jgi:6,7-dimethyl-8-ribityllumazine synthase
MSTELHHLSDKASEILPDASGLRFAIVVSEWNSEITGKLREGARSAFLHYGANSQDIIEVTVPGSFELVFAAKRLAESLKPDAIIGLGCVIRGETPHFDYVCSGVTQGFAALNAEGKIPYIFGLLTTDTIQQSLDRAGGKLGNKGTECAVTAIRMASLAKSFKDAALL